MTEEKKRNRYDTTSTKRQVLHLAKLVAEKGKRLPIDLDASRLQKIDALISAGVGTSAAAVVRKAIDELHEKMCNKA